MFVGLAVHYMNVTKVGKYIALYLDINYNDA